MRKRKMEKELEKFLHKQVRINFDVGNGRIFFYQGELSEISDDFLAINDRKLGHTMISKKLVVQIYEVNGGGQR